MINVDKIVLSDDEDVKKLWFFRTLIDWHEIDVARDLPEGLYIHVEDIVERLTSKYLKISCSEGYYLHIPKVKGTEIQYSSASDDNSATSQLYVYDNNPREYYIELSDGLIDMPIKAGLIKKIILDVRSETNERIQKYGIILIIEYKDNGLKNNPNYILEPSVAVHKLYESSLIYNAIDITFWALVVFEITRLVLAGSLEWASITYVEIAIVFSYLAQLWFRVIHIGNTFLNSFALWTRVIKSSIVTHRKTRLQKNRFSLKAFEMEITQLYRKAKR